MAIYTDSATVKVAITHSGIESHTHFDAATVYIDLTASAVECKHSPDFTGEGVAYAQYETFEAEAQFTAEEAFAQYEASLRYGVFNAQNDC